MMKLIHDDPNRQQPGTGIRFNGAELTGLVNVDNMERPLSPEELAAFGFDCYSIDLIDGPPAVLSYLAANFNLHRIPMQLTRRPVDARGVEATRRIQRYYTLDGSASIRYSMYGQRLAQLETRTLDKAKILGNGGASSARCGPSPCLSTLRADADRPWARPCLLAVDQARIDYFVNKINESRASRQTLKAEFDRSREIAQELVEQVEQIETERVRRLSLFSSSLALSGIDDVVELLQAQLSAERDKMHKARAQWLKIKSKLGASSRPLSPLKVQAQS